VLVLAALCGAAGAQEGDEPNGVLLVAKPGMPDPRFRETVILATQAPDGHTVGVILNRPTDAKLSAFSTDPRAHAYDGAVGYGGPVLDGAIVAMFRSPSRPAAPAFHALRGVYLSMHPRALEQALAAPPRDVRFYLGFSGWTPGQLRTELKEGWHVLPATEEIAFRADTSGLWTELIEKTRRFRTRAAPLPRAILVP
jgi:putative transcriptional regulator